VTNTIDCPRCSGCGYLTEDVADRWGEHETVETPCERCEGTGSVEADDREEAA
jgi:DnaJ-class molecular chaperone